MMKSNGNKHIRKQSYPLHSYIIKNRCTPIVNRPSFWINYVILQTNEAQCIGIELPFIVIW